jgi:hypothetical protein
MEDEDDVREALDRSLNILNEPLKQAVLSKLASRFHISLQYAGVINYSEKDIESALADIFKAGSSIIIKNFHIELENIRGRNKHL